MRIVVTSDIHFGLVAAGDESSRRMADKINGLGADVLILGGDNAAFDEARFRGCFDLFSGFAGTRLFIAGNHDLWTKSADSYEIYTSFLSRIGREHGFHYLDAAPVVLNGIGFVGNVGWYDYSFKDPDLHVSEEIIRSKRLPGFCVWMDSEYIRWSFDDLAFTDLCVRTLDEHLRAVEADCSQIVAVTHHLPFEELVIRKPHDMGWSFGNAFMGSRKLGAVLLSHEKVKHAFCGHSHSRASITKGPILATMLGSDYRQKSYELLEI